MANLIYFQRGVSMVGLMIGLLISMIGILAVTNSHKSLIHASVEAKTDSIHDIYIATILTQVEMDIQGAGFGLEPAGVGTAVATNLFGNPAILWKLKDDGKITCKGLTEVGYNENGIAGRKVFSLTATSGCQEATELTNIDIEWGRQLSAQFQNQPNQLFEFEVNNATCSPYGFGRAKSRLQAKVTAMSSAVAAGADITPVSYKFCLLNTHT